MARIQWMLGQVYGISKKSIRVMPASGPCWDVCNLLSCKGQCYNSSIFRRGPALGGLYLRKSTDFSQMEMPTRVPMSARQS